MSETDVAFLHAPTSDAAPSASDAQAVQERFAAESAFWNDAIGPGANVIMAMTSELDSLTGAIGLMPGRAPHRRRVVGRYLDMIKTLAAAWSDQSRPALLLALIALKQGGDSLANHDAPLLSAALNDMLHGRFAAGRSAQRLLDGLVRRLSAPACAFETIRHDFASYLAQLAAASSDLESDTVLLTQRLQADQVHALILAQRINTLEARLSQARERRNQCWLQGVQNEQIRHDISAHRAALDQTRRQLDQLRADQAATSAQASYLQGLLPGLARYLGGIERMDAALQAALFGTQALQESLTHLQAALLHGPGSAAAACAQLDAALPHWRALSARVAALLERQDD